MARGITFRSREEANEYSTRLREEGWRTATAYDKETNTWVVVKVARGELSVVGEEAEGETPLAEEKAVAMPSRKARAKARVKAKVKGTVRQIGRGIKTETLEGIGLQPPRRYRRPSEAVEIGGKEGEKLSPTARRREKLARDLAALERGELEGIEEIRPSAASEEERRREWAAYKAHKIKTLGRRALKATEKPLETMRRHSVKAGMIRSIPTAVGLHPMIFESGERTPRIVAETPAQARIASVTGIPKIARSLGVSKEVGFKLNGVRLRTPYLKSSPRKEEET